MFVPRLSPQWILLLLAPLCLVSHPAHALCQSSEEHNRPRSLASVIEQERETVVQALSAEPERRFALGGISFPSLSSIEYVDSVRSISPARRDLIRRWIASYAITSHSLDMYQSEVLFREDSLEVWLPVQTALVEDLRAQAQRGDRVILFIVWVGALGTPGDVDWVFLVYGFRGL